MADSRSVSFGGKTDRQIAMEILAAMAVSEDEAGRHVPAVIDALEREMELAVEEIRRGGHVPPGVRALLRRLGDRPDVVQSVVTGNVAANARLKLGAFGLDAFLDLEIGAFGSDHADRDELVPVAMRKLEATRGLRILPRDVWVVGDTPRDLDCARAAGARCLLVATGLVPFEELAPLGAEVVLPDLSNVAEVERLLLDGPL